LIEADVNGVGAALADLLVGYPNIVHRKVFRHGILVREAPGILIGDASKPRLYDNARRLIASKKWVVRDESLYREITHEDEPGNMLKAALVALYPESEA